LTVDGDLAAFVGVSALVIVTPGQDTALTIRNALLAGRRGGVATALGVATGQLVWAAATSAGVAALLVASELAFLALKFAGAVYLVVLGVQALVGALGDGGRTGDRAHGIAERRRAPAVAFRQGVISNLGNPKMAVFFTSLLPQFAHPGDGSFIELLLLGVVFSSLTLVWLTGYALAVARAGDLLRRPRVRRILDGLTGAALVALGLRLATAHR
jgi:threonine/homoserine/homoserine lactone efflux protein